VIYAGIDPGKRGAIAVLDATGLFLRVIAMPVVTAPKGRDEYDVVEIRNFLAAIHRGSGLFVVVERLHPMPGILGGAIANFSRGVARGFEWLLLAMEIPHLAVPSQVWQRSMFVGTPGEDPKQRSILAAHSLFPSVPLRRSDRSRKDDDGFADALLLAEYGRRTRTAPPAN
jgi:hypothetical protein